MSGLGRQNLRIVQPYEPDAPPAADIEVEFAPESADLPEVDERGNLAGLVADSDPDAGFDAAEIAAARRASLLLGNAGADADNGAPGSAVSGAAAASSRSSRAPPAPGQPVYFSCSSSSFRDSRLRL